MSTIHEDLEGNVSYWSAPNTIVQGVLSFGVDASNNITQAKQLKERYRTTATALTVWQNAARTIL